MQYEGSAILHSGQYQEWTTNGRIGYETTAIYGVPNASNQATITEMNWVNWLHNPCHRGGPKSKSRMAHKWADWLHNPCHLGDPQTFRAGGNINNGPQVGGLAT